MPKTIRKKKSAERIAVESIVVDDNVLFVSIAHVKGGKSEETQGSIRKFSVRLDDTTIATIKRNLDDSFALIQAGGALSLADYTVKNNLFCLSLSIKNDAAHPFRFRKGRYLSEKQYFGCADLSKDVKRPRGKVAAIANQYKILSQIFWASGVVVPDRPCYYYFIRPSLKHVIYDRVLYLSSKTELDISKIKQYSFFLSGTLGESLIELIKKNALLSALAAIMARNMSHNQGSHVMSRIIRESLVNDIRSKGGSSVGFDPIGLVLDDAAAALDELANSDEKELTPRLGRAVHYLEEIHALCGQTTGPDKVRLFANDTKIFTAYLQQRADFVAQICTDRQQWTAPSCLSHDLMAWFLKQRHVLNFIAASEGLKATTFKDGAPIKETGKTTKVGGHIGFVIRLLKPKNGEPAERHEIEPVMNFTAISPDEKTTFPQRIPVAFPGGKTGWHAFFVILEGFIRNAAKHGYSQLAEDRKKRFDLNVIIDVVDDGKTCIKHERDGGGKTVSKPAYTVRIYSNVDQDKLIEEGRLGDRIVKNDEKDSSPKEKWRWKWTSDLLNERLSGSFVDLSGKMEKKYWGLSEFRICAGHLQNADVIAIGDRQSENVLERVLHLQGESPIKEGYEHEKEHAHDEFSPHENIKGIENDTRIRKKTEIARIKAGCEDCGSILLKPICNMRPGQEYDLKANGFKHKCPKNRGADMSPRFYYEFKMLKPRIIGMEVDEKKPWNKESRRFEGWEVYPPESESLDRCFEYYILNSSDWYHRLIQTTLATEKSKELNDIIFNNIHSPTGRKFFGRFDYYPGRLFAVLDEESIAKEIPRDSDDPGHAMWWRLRKRICVLSQGDFETLEEIYARTEEGATDLAALFLQKKWTEHVLRNIRGFSDEGLKLYHFPDESDSSKNDEPPYVPDTTPFLAAVKSGDNTAKNNMIPLIPGKNGKNGALVFGRHFGMLEQEGSGLDIRSRTVGVDDADTVLYAESMSGGASYFSLAAEAFQEVDANLLPLLSSEKPSPENIAGILSPANIAKIANLRTAYQFAESALLRVVLIDERIQEQFGKFRSDQLVGVSEQQVYVGYLKNAGEKSETNNLDSIQPAPAGGLTQTGHVDVFLENNEKIDSVKLNGRKLKPNKKKSNEKRPRLAALWPKSIAGDVLVIHQGIIDKWHEGLKKKNRKIDDTQVLIKALKARFPYVVVTSGRGRPDDVPSGVRFLPFSSFESSPQGNFYEKHSLIQQVLAIVEEEKEG